MSRTRVAVVFGGRSTEHTISCASAGSVLAAIDRDRYDVVSVGITAQGRWVLGPDDPAQLEIVSGRLPDVHDGQALVLPADPTAGGLIALQDGPGILGEVDVVFPLLHGPYGEDGTIQGLLELADLPYVGSGVLASAAAMDKAVAKVLLRAAGLPVADCVKLRAGEATEGALALDLPVFVKPARGGSSIGIGRVDDWANLDAALTEAFAADPKVLVEQGMSGREIELGVLQDSSGLYVSVPAEVRVIASGGFYDFQAKYLEELTAVDIPAHMPLEVTKRLREMAGAAFRALGCEGLARVDFFLAPDGTPTVNEVNTMPGFTPTSMFPRMWEASGVPYPQLIDRLLQAALNRPRGLR